jgi:hypothetical protein
MPPSAALPLSALVRAQLTRPSPIRQIMKMAERQNIVAMAPEASREAYREIVSS